MTRTVPYWLLSCTLVALAVSGLTLFAQAQRGYSGVDEPRIVSGSNIGFRVEGVDPRTGNPTGTWMLRLDGAWREIGSMPLVRNAR